MIERGLYYATDEFSQMIRSVGGTWNDTKRRPIVCLIKSDENPNLYWAIPMGKLNHRNAMQQKRLNFYLNLPKRDIRSCYYHIGRTSSRDSRMIILFQCVAVDVDTAIRNIISIC